MDGCMDGWVDGWMDGWMHASLSLSLLSLPIVVYAHIVYIMYTQPMLELCWYRSSEYQNVSPTIVSILKSGVE